MTSATVSVGSALDQATARLTSAGLPDARREALALWSALAGTAPGNVWLTREADASPDHVRRFRRAVERRASGEPRAYVVGTAGFRSLDLEIDGRVLIPRPETEGIVDLVLSWGHARSPAGGWGIAADVGTGSGCLALSLAVEGRFDRVIATDSSPEALDVAAANLAAIRPATAVELRAGSLLDPLGDLTIDVLVCNPPYLTDEEYAALDRSVRAYEPRSALVSGATGLEHTDAVLRAAGRVVSSQGLVVLEVDSARSDRTVALAAQAGWRARVERDLFGRFRYLVASKEC